MPGRDRILKRNALRRKILWTIVSALLFLSLWELAAYLVNKALILPGPLDTLGEFVRIVSRPDFFIIVGSTMERIIVSFLLALGMGLILGIPAGIWERLELLLSVPMKIMRAVPTMGIILLSLIWLDSEGAPYLVCTLVVFPLLYGGILSSIRAVDPGLLELHRVYPVPFFRKVRHFYLPAIMPSFRGSVAAALGLNVKVMIAAEVLSQPSSAIGTAFQIERARLNTAGVFGWSLVVILLSSALDYLFHLFAAAGSRKRMNPQAEAAS